MTKNIAQPIIKWSGSKRSQAPEIVKLIDKSYDVYYEPFCGGASVLFYILLHFPYRFEKYVCSDWNNDLISTFNQIKNEPAEIFERYTELWEELNKDNNLERKKEYFNRIRKEFNKTKDPNLFFFIMRTTTNGMPRYNKDGEFNNSFHVTRNGITPENLKPILRRWHFLLNLNRVEFVHCDYRQIKPSSSDFVYLDPPYYHTKGMYYGAINYDEFFQWLRKLKCDYFLSFDGMAGELDQTIQLPKDLYDDHRYLFSGNSSFRRVIGKNKNTVVKESLYIKKVNSNFKQATVGKGLK